MVAGHGPCAPAAMEVEGSWAASSWGIACSVSSSVAWNLAAGSVASEPVRDHVVLATALMQRRQPLAIARAGFLPCPPQADRHLADHCGRLRICAYEAHRSPLTVCWPTGAAKR